MRVRGVLIVLTGFLCCMPAYRLVCTVFTEYVSVCMCVVPVSTAFTPLLRD
jgi:hypothetical protein